MYSYDNFLVPYYVLSNVMNPKVKVKVNDSSKRL